MKLTNLDAAISLAKQIKNAELALKSINTLLGENPNGSAPYNSTLSDKKLWGFIIGQHSDGSGAINCNGLEVSCEILKFTRDALLDKITEWTDLIEKL
jgi:hypothetical protein